MREAADAVIAQFGQPDIVVNNAAIGDIIKPLPELSLQEWQRVMTVNLTGAFLWTREASRVMTSGSSVINIASKPLKRVFGKWHPTCPQARHDRTDTLRRSIWPHWAFA